MTSITSPRAQFGLILPSTNTVVEAEFNWMRVEGVSWHTGRIYIPQPVLDDDASFVSFLENLRVEIGRAVRDVVTAEVDSLVMGMSAETFWGGKEGAEEFAELMSTLSEGRAVTTGAMACKMALDVYGAKKIGIITPYQPVGDAQVRRFFEEIGYEVHDVHGLKCDTATSIGDVTPDELKAAFRAVDAADVDVLLQAGTNLPCSRVAAEMEIELGKPVIAINTATVWAAYRTNGIDDKLEGFGSLFSEH
ncbi:arylmalonate decarboxylase [Microbacterium sp. 1.5R]|uniref:maleate cis-trans isomerase family protein n=1 Tax=Microbacterium sp. 1.5R TaxID=1916917 RepID=UPI0011A372B9|nr:arylmalonate decarboxylase [Microbacterium sp. 1.5R]